MSSQVEIANLALSVIGTRSTISSLSESSAEARQVSLQYSPALDALLAAAFWNFARRQVSLTLLKDGTLSPPDDVPLPWTYEYAYPDDCVTARYILPLFQTSSTGLPGTPASQPLNTGQPVRFLISSDLDPNGNQTKVILTNQPAANLVYTSRVTNPNLYDSQFTLALAALIGSRVAIPLSGDKALARMAFEAADRMAREARVSNGNEGITVIDVVPDWIRARGYNDDWAYPGGTVSYSSPQNLVFVS